MRDWPVDSLPGMPGCGSGRRPRIDERAGRGRIDIIIDADREPGAGVVTGIDAGRAVQVQVPAPLGVLSLINLTSTDSPGFAIVSPSARRVPAARSGS